MRINSFTEDEAYQIMKALAEIDGSLFGAEGRLKSALHRLYTGGGIIAAREGTSLFNKTVHAKQPMPGAQPNAGGVPHIAPSVPPEMAARIRNAQPHPQQTREGDAFGPSEFSTPQDLG